MAAHVDSVAQRSFDAQRELLARQAHAAVLPEHAEGVLVCRADHNERAHEVLLLLVRVRHQNGVLECEQRGAHRLGVQLHLDRAERLLERGALFVLVVVHLVEAERLERADHRQTAGVLHVAVVVQTDHVYVEDPGELALAYAQVGLAHTLGLGEYVLHELREHGLRLLDRGGRGERGGRLLRRARRAEVLGRAESGQLDVAYDKALVGPLLLGSTDARRDAAHDARRAEFGQRRAANSVDTVHLELARADVAQLAVVGPAILLDELQIVLVRLSRLVDV